MFLLPALLIVPCSAIKGLKAFSVIYFHFIAAIVCIPKKILKSFVSFL